MAVQAREAEKRRWSKKLLTLLSVSVRETGPAPRLPARCMLVLNHISWLDVFVIDANFPATFVAKSEVRNWPLVGWLCTLVGTIYIERGKRAHVRRAREMVAKELVSGTLIAVCPEGTTTYGDRLEPFHAALFQPAIDAEATVQSLALRYTDRSGRLTEAAGYVGETSLLGSLWSIVSAPHIVAEMTFARAISAEGETRRSLAEKAEAAIARALGVAAPHPRRKTPETESGLPA
jgi:1-acyl-sn-glycerol-3-phosphate acyltransferase